MNITWLGHSCFKFEEKINGQNFVIVTDPYDKSTGLKLPKTKADLITVSHYHDDHSNYEAIEANERQPVLLDRPGEYEVGGVFVFGIGSFHDKKQGAEYGKSVMFKFNIEGVKILHLGDLGTTLSDKQLEKIEDVDILLIPVGGKYTVDAKVAAEIVRQIEPRIVVPMHYKIPGLTLDVDGVENFKKEMGSGAEVVSKLKISKKDLPQEETKVVIFEKA